MFIVNRHDTFLSIPIDTEQVSIDICFENDAPTMQIYYDLGCIDKSLTLTEVCDLIDALEEVKSRLRGK